MIFIACQNGDCVNKGAPYFLEEDYKDVACPCCGEIMQEIPDPEGTDGGAG